MPTIGIPTENKILNGHGLTTLVGQIKKDLVPKTNTSQTVSSTISNSGDQVSIRSTDSNSNSYGTIQVAPEFIVNRVPNGILAYHGEQVQVSATGSLDLQGNIIQLGGNATIPTQNFSVVHKKYVDGATYSIYNSITNSLATVATTGAYSDLTGTPDLSVYLTSETEPLFTSWTSTAAAYGITNGDIMRWNNSEPNIITEVRENGSTLNIIGGVVDISAIPKEDVTPYFSSGKTIAVIGGLTLYYSPNVISLATSGKQIALVEGKTLYAPSIAVNSVGLSGATIAYIDGKTIGIDPNTALISSYGSLAGITHYYSGHNYLYSIDYKLAAYSETITQDKQVTTKKYVDDAITTAIGGITGISFNTSYTTYSDLPATGDPGTIYLIPNGGTIPNTYDEYVFVGTKYEKIGTTEADLTSYVAKSDVTPLTTTGRQIANIGGTTIYADQIATSTLRKGQDITGQGGVTLGVQVLTYDGKIFNVPIYDTSITLDQQVTTKKYVDNATTSVYNGITNNYVSNADVVPSYPSTGISIGTVAGKTFYAPQGGGGGGSVVTVTPLTTSGMAIANISVDGAGTSIYAPTYNLTAATNNMATTGMLTSATTNMATTGMITAATNNLATKNMLTSATTNMATTGMLTSATTNMATTGAITAATSNMATTGFVNASTTNVWNNVTTNYVALSSVIPDPTATGNPIGEIGGKTFYAPASTGTVTQVQSNWTETDNTKPAYIKNKPTLATVATTGAYSDLSGKPSLATVATTGAYSDLSGTPTIPTVTATRAFSTGTALATITVNNTSTTINVPTASSSTAGITKVGASGGAAAYSHTHDYSKVSVSTSITAGLPLATITVNNNGTNTTTTVYQQVQFTYDSANKKLTLVGATVVS